uniref:Uncharacterized protein n=1 Tax=Strongyloides stercoralis TaxID=6248 RepID=A0AAF5I262_STRER
SSCSCFILFLIWITPRRIRTTSDKFNFRIKKFCFFRLISIQFKLFSPTSTINGCLEDQLGSKRNSYYLSLISHITFLDAAREVDRIQNNNSKDQHCFLTTFSCSLVIFMLFFTTLYYTFNFSYFLNTLVVFLLSKLFLLLPYLFLLLPYIFCIPLFWLIFIDFVTTGSCSSTEAGFGALMRFWSELEAGTIRISDLEAVLRQFHGYRSLLL